MSHNRGNGSATLREVGEAVPLLASVIGAFGALAYAIMVPYSSTFYGLFYSDSRISGMTAASVVSYGALTSVIATLGGAILLGYLVRRTQMDSRTFRIALHCLFWVLLPIAILLQVQGAATSMRATAWALFCGWVWSAAALIFRHWKTVTKNAIVIGGVIVILIAFLVLQPVGQAAARADSIRLIEASPDAVPRSSIWQRLAGIPAFYPAETIIKSGDGVLDGHIVRIILMTDSRVILLDLESCRTVSVPLDSLVISNGLDHEVAACKTIG